MKGETRVRINPLSQEAKEMVETHGNLMLLLKTKEKGPYNDWNDNILLKPTVGYPFQYWFRNGIDIEFELT